MIFPLLVVSSVFSASAVAAEKSTGWYRAFIEPIPGTDSDVAGTVYLAQLNVPGRIGYYGVGTGLSPNRGDCTGQNACGAHIHEGFSCESTDLQGGHYHDVSKVPDDPWVDDRWYSDDNGDAVFNAILDIGTDDLVGRAFILHDENGDRVGCGLLQDFSTSVLKADTVPLSGSSVTGMVQVIQATEELVCFAGEASDLEVSLTSVHSLSEEGPNCSSKNGCGAHIHEGYSCVDLYAQMAHLYNMDVLDEDPWAIVGYTSTSSEGKGYFMHCLNTGFTDLSEIEGRAFIVHSNDGSRVSCGLLGNDGTASSTNTEPDPTQSRVDLAETSAANYSKGALLNLASVTIVAAAISTFY